MSQEFAPSLLKERAARQVGREAAFLVPWIRPDMRVLDCGCGPGGISIGLAQLVPAGEVVGIDRKPEQLECGRIEAERQGLRNLRFQEGTIHALDFADFSFDAVLVHAVLYHVSNPEQALTEIHRVLKPGGVVGLRDSYMEADVYFPRNAILDEFWTLAARLTAHRGGDPSLGRRHRQLLRTAGFEEALLSASIDSYGTREAIADYAESWADWAVDHKELIVAQKWALEEDVERMADQLRTWGAHPDAFFGRFRCEAVTHKSIS